MFQDPFKNMTEAAEKFILNSKTTFKPSWEALDCCNSTFTKLSKTYLDATKQLLDQQSHYLTNLAEAATVAELSRAQSDGMTTVMGAAIKQGQNIFQTSLECFEEWRKMFQEQYSETIKATGKNCSK